MIVGIGDGISAEELIVPGVYDATETGTGVDKTEYEGQCKVTVWVGDVGGTNPELDVTIEHSDDDQTYETEAVATFDTIDAAGVPVSVVLNADSLKKYVRAVATIGGTTPQFTMCVLFQGQKKSI
jgi:glucokinase